jgi:hypothetical protein
MIPAQIHTTFGLVPDFGGKPFSFIHYACVLSWVRVLKMPVTIYSEFFPGESDNSNKWWNLTLQLPGVHAYYAGMPLSFKPKMTHSAHRSDWMRLRWCLEHGGIGLDIDVFALRPLLFPPAVTPMLGRINGDYGLCNAVMIASKGDEFIKRWGEAYSSFNPAEWDAHSVRLPGQMAKWWPHLVTVLPEHYFFEHGWGDVGQKALFEDAEREPHPEAMLAHLWQTATWPTRLEHLTPETVRQEKGFVQRRIVKLIEAEGL